VPDARKGQLARFLEVRCIYLEINGLKRWRVRNYRRQFMRRFAGWLIFAGSD